MKIFKLFIIMGIFFSQVVFAKNLAGVEIKDNLSIEGTTFVYNGAGIRSKFFMDIYVITLFTKAKTTSAVSILEQDSAVTLNIVSGMLTKEKMVNAIKDGFVKVTNNNISPIKAELEKFDRFFEDELKKGDEITLLKQADTIIVIKNDKKLGQIDSPIFAKNLFKIWIGDKSIDKDLKKELLGK